MRIRYVVSTMAFWWRENKLSFEQECDFFRSMGFGVELWPSIKGQNECRYERHNWSRLIAATEGMLVSMRSRTDCPSLEQWNVQIECAKLLGANIVTDLHSLGIPDGPEVNGCGLANEVVELAERNEIKLCLETGRLPTLLSVGKKFESIWYCLDTGYINLDREVTFERYVDELAPRTAHLHLSDNYGRTDDHEPPGLRGGISRRNWDYLLNTLSRYDNDLVGSLEMYPSMPAVMIRQAGEFLFDQLKWPNQPKKQRSYAGIAYTPI